MSEAAAKRSSARPKSYQLPELLAEIAEVAGLPAALAIADVRGGTRMHFPAKCADGHWLTRAVGREAADKLCDHFRVSRRGGVALTVPIGPTHYYDRAKLMTEAMIESGRSIGETARALRVATRTVERWNAARRRSGKSEASDRLRLAKIAAETGRQHATAHTGDGMGSTAPAIVDQPGAETRNREPFAPVNTVTDARGLGEVTDDV